MTGRHAPESWDDALDRQLREALDVDPSPSFRSRVRARLDAEPIPSRFRVNFGLAAAAAAVAVIALGGTMSSRLWNTHSSPVYLASRPALVAAAPYVAPVVAKAIEVAPLPGAREGSAVGTGNVDDSASPRRAVTAQFAPEERAAFRLFVSMARTGRFPAPESLPLAGTASEAVPAIELPPIEIPPVIADAGEGVSQ